MSDRANRYLPPFSIIQKLIVRNTETGKFIVDADAFFLLLELAAYSAGFDEDWYCANNSDVASAKQAGDIASGLEHFARSGYFEGRLPSSFHVDESWYRQNYMDVANAIAEGKVASAQSHFAITGYYEGRVAAPEQRQQLERWQAAASEA